MSGVRRYLFVMMLCALAAGVAAAALPRVVDALSCDASGYRNDTYLAHCLNKYFADYEHGAMMYGLEPAALDSIRKADVLFLGNSRTQFAFSTEAVRRYFSDRGLRRYVLGFGYNETSGFSLAVMQRAQAAPKVLVVNADPFFADGMSEPARAVLEGGLAVQTEYTMKKSFQFLHKTICSEFPKICLPPAASMFRSSDTGEWIPGAVWAGVKVAIPIGPARQVRPDDWEAQATAARAFMATARIDPACVIITAIPTGHQGIALPADAAHAAGAQFIAPTLDGLATLDGSHLNRESAERWSAAFLEAADSVIRECAGNRSEHSADRQGAD